MREDGFLIEWDEAKNLANQRKHRVSFEEAAQVFRDLLFVSIQDRVEDTEARWQTFGVVGGLKLIMVAHTYQDEDLFTRVRIISARAANKLERRIYEDHNG